MENGERSSKPSESKNPRANHSVKADIILAAGLVFLLFGIVYGILNLSSGDRDISVLAPVLFISSGEILLFVTFAFTKGTGTFFCGIYLALLGITVLILASLKYLAFSIDTTELIQLAKTGKNPSSSYGLLSDRLQMSVSSSGTIVMSS